MKKWLIIFLFTSLTSSLSAKAFHLLLIGDTADPNVGTAAVKSLQNIEQSFSYISSVSGIPLHITKLTSAESTFTYSNVMWWASKEKVARDDIIVLFYDGHGGRLKNSPTIWPCGGFPDCYLADFSLVIRKLLAKKAALSLIIIDSCNIFMDKNNQSFKFENWPDNKAYFQLTGMNDALVAAGTRTLFSKPYGLIIATSSLPGTPSSAKPERPNQIGFGEDYKHVVGSVFINIFLNNLFQELQSPSPRWKQVFKRAQNEAKTETQKPNYQSVQTAQYRIFLYKHRRRLSVYKKNLFKGCAYHEKSLLGKAIDCLAEPQQPCSCYLGKNIDEFEEETDEDKSLPFLEN